MNHLYLTLGLPGSGKSTVARAHVDASGGKMKRVNKDDLRAMMDNGKWSGKREKEIVNTQNVLVNYWLEAGYDVVVDNTNFGWEEHFRKVAENHKVGFVLLDLTDVPVAECIKRDLARPSSVGSKVIQKMYLKHLAKAYEPPVNDPAKQPCIIVDIDGTLAHMAGRSPYDYTQVHTDVLDHVVANLVADQYEKGLTVILCSGRKEDCRDLTETWLDRHGIPYHELYMRESGDDRDDAIVKGEIYDEHIAPLYNVKYVLDDRDRVVAMWRARGLKVLQVAEGDF